MKPRILVTTIIQTAHWPEHLRVPALALVMQQLMNPNPNFK